MDPSLYSSRNGGLSLHELLEAIEDEEKEIAGANIYILPPDDDTAETEEDSDFSDEENGDVNHLPRGILSQTCELNIEWNSSDDDDEDHIPLSLIRNKLQRPTSNSQPQPSTSKGQPPKKKTRKSHTWSDDVPAYDMNMTCLPKPPSDKAYQAENPIDFLKLFFDEELMQHILRETNRYGNQKNNNLNFSISELYVVLGAFALSGYTKLPNKRMFWNSSNDVPKILCDSIRLNRFEQLLHCMHFSNNDLNNNTDKLFKLRPVIDALNKNFREHGGLEEYLSIDESMIPYYGRHYAKQYIKGKPIRFGYKNWALCTSSGFMVTFDIYTGKSDNEKQFGLGGDVVLSLIHQAQIQGNQGYKLYFDNYFTGINLLDHLSENKFCATGTIRSNRLEGSTFPGKSWWKKEPRGTNKFLSNGKILLSQWKDNKVVTVATNFEGKDMTTANRWCRETKTRKPIPQPKIISSYNRGMGGVDKMDGLIAVYRSRMRQRKWYWPIFQYLVDASIVNGWLLMKKLKPNDPNCSSLIVFRRYIALGFLHTHGRKPLRYKQPTAINSVRFDNIGHLVQYCESDRKCKQCNKNSKFVCLKCNIGLHPKVCFLAYHTQ